MTYPEFIAFKPIPRLNREVIATEKIDGTNAVIFIDENIVVAGSRNRWLTLESDNFGFARWVQENADELRKLGPGRHYGEWWGSGIQRRYGLSKKRFSLFNVGRWGDDLVRPSCCHVVPVLSRANNFQDAEAAAVSQLREHGSFAAPGFMNPEGIVLFHSASGSLYKVTLEGDEKPKSVKT